MSNKPIKTYSAGTLSVSVWENEIEEGKKLTSVTYQKSYKDKEDNWQQTQQLHIEDVPRLSMLFAKAYDAHQIKER